LVVREPDWFARLLEAFCFLVHPLVHPVSCLFISAFSLCFFSFPPSPIAERPVVGRRGGAKPCSPRGGQKWNASARLKFSSGLTAFDGPFLEEAAGSAAIHRDVWFI